MPRSTLLWTVCLALFMAAGFGCRNEPAPAPATGGDSRDTAATAPSESGARPPTPAGTTTRPATLPSDTPVAGTQTGGWEPTEPAPRELGPAPRVEMRIRQGEEDWGWIVLELDEKRAPITVRNFLRYVDEGFYNGTIFHRIMSDFMIQGGGFTALKALKTEGLHEPIENESRNGVSNTRGTISMARTTAPHSATSQFFINVVDNGHRLDPSPPSGWGYTVFGRVVEGMDVVDRVRDVETRIDPEDRRPNPEKSVPVNPPVIVVAQRAK